MRIGAINQVRKHFDDSTILLGKNKVMALALGKDEASEVNENTHKVAERLTVIKYFYIMIMYLFYLCIIN
jgi:hypothetical protein